MTKAFRYSGFSNPNGTIVPDDVFDVIAPELTEAELRVLLYVVRRTFGFKKNADAISVSQMVNGITTRDGRVLDRGTGMSKSAVWRGAKGLVEKGILLKEETRSENGEYETNVFSLHFASEAEMFEKERNKSENQGYLSKRVTLSLQKNYPHSRKEIPYLSRRVHNKQYYNKQIYLFRTFEIVHTLIFLWLTLRRKPPNPIVMDQLRSEIPDKKSTEQPLSNRPTSKDPRSKRGEWKRSEKSSRRGEVAHRNRRVKSAR